MAEKVYSHEKAVEYMPDTIVIPNCILFTPIVDTIISGEKLGHLIVCPGSQMIVYDGIVSDISKLPTGKSVGSFMFIGVNPKFFNHIFKNIITGKYTSDKTVHLDTKSSLASFELVHIIKETITNNWDRLNV